MIFTKSDGMIDCIAGTKHSEGKGAAYDIGCGEQYQKEQSKNHGFFEDLLEEVEKREAATNEIK